MRAPTGHFLDIERSVTGRAWIDRLVDRQSGLAIAQRHDLPELLGRVLAARGVAPDAVEGYLQPTLRSLLPDPHVLQDMPAAAARLADAVTNGEGIAVFGDYDVDGATASALLRRFLVQAGSDAEIYIPDRLSEGYGPNSEAFASLQARGARLVVTVDCGVAAHDPLEAARGMGLDVVVIDHHQAGERLPEAVAVVNPNRQDDLSGLGDLAAVGVTFLLVVAVNRVLRERGWYGDDRREPDLLGLLDLVALGTVCDVVPLRGLNRALVAQGFKVMAKRGNTGLRALGEVARLTGAPDTFAAGFLLGPRINAAGRMGQSALGAELLCTEDAARAAEIAHLLDGLNTQRKAQEAEVLQAAVLQAERALGVTASAPVLVVADSGWAPGVIGIVAGRLRERFDRPAVVIALDEAYGVGSARSIGGVDLGAAVRGALEAGLLVRGGGHAMAAGLTVEHGRIGQLRAFLEQQLAGPVAQALARPGLKIDGAVSAGGVSLDLLALLERAGPFGVGNPRPRLAFPAHRVSYAKVVGDGHVRCTVSAGDGARLQAIAFRAQGTPLGEALLADRGAPLHLAGHVSANEWGGRISPQLVIEDAARIGRG